jgi:hypothetical protein
MKKLLLFLSIAGMFVTALNAQTFVSTHPSNRNAIIEEYTGIYCVYCPDGHRRVNELMADSNRVWAINIHQGNYAAPAPAHPDFRTPWGNALAAQTGLTGYPAATVNRQVFEDAKTSSSDRGKWGPWATQIMGNSSPVNIAAQATIDFNTRILTVNVEVYYTGNSDSSSNFINVALLQDSILGPQTGGTNFNPAQVEGDLYRHMHMLRHLLTGQWGDEITTTTTGTFVSKQYTYTIPQHLNNVEYILEHLRVIAFITESHQYIITGNEASMELLNAKPYFVSIKEKETYTCDDGQFYASLKNIWNNQDITSANFEYSYGGNTYTLSWSNRTIGFYQSDTILFPKIDLTSGVARPISITLTALNGSPFAGETRNITLQKAKYDVHKNNITLKLVTDRYASETTVKLYNSAGQVIFSQGPWDNLGTNSTTVRTFELPLAAAGCYKLEVNDAFGDGINGGAGNGYVELLNAANTRIAYNNGKFGAQLAWYLNCDGTVSIDDIDNANFAIYPNPVSDLLNIQSDDPIQKIEIYNTLGQLIKTERATSSVNVAHLSSGIYAVKVYTPKGVKVQKIVKK